MTNKDIETLRDLCRKSRIAIYVVKDLANIGKQKPVTDVTRRRREINKQNRINLSRDDVHDIFKEFSRLGWGKLHISSGSSDNSRFAWDKSIDYKALCVAVVEDKSLVQAGGVTSRAHVLSTDRRSRTTTGPALVLDLDGDELRLSLPQAKSLLDQLKGFLGD